MTSRHHNPERSAWRGRSHKNGGERVRALREAPNREDAMSESKVTIVVRVTCKESEADSIEASIRNHILTIDEVENVEWSSEGGDTDDFWREDRA